MGWGARKTVAGIATLGDSGPLPYIYGGVTCGGPVGSGGGLGPVGSTSGSCGVRYGISTYR